MLRKSMAERKMRFFDSRSQNDFGTTGYSSFEKDILRKHQLCMNQRLAQDGYINKQQFMRIPKSVPIYA